MPRRAGFATVKYGMAGPTGTRPGLSAGFAGIDRRWLTHS
jgi:hypothetical protein